MYVILYHMTSTTHSLVAISLALVIKNPALTLPVCFASNYILDTIPHWDFGFGWRQKTKKKILAEGVLDVVLSYFLVFLIQRFFFPEVSLLYLFASAFFAQLPDWLEVPYLLFNWKSQPFAFFYQIQHILHRRMDLPWGIVSQIIVCLPLLYLILR